MIILKSPISLTLCLLSDGRFAFKGYSDDDRNYPNASDQSKMFCYCGRMFSHFKNLTYHQKWECGQQLTCGVCYTMYPTKSSLMRHEKICNKTYRSPSTHTMTVENASFSNLISAKISRNIKSKALPKYIVICKCGRRFSHKKNFTYHQKWECGKLLMCYECNITFPAKSGLLKHNRMVHAANLEASECPSTATESVQSN